MQSRDSTGFRRLATDASREGSRPMLRWLLQRQIAAFEGAWNYDASYMHEVIGVDPRAMLALGKLQAISSYRKGVPPADYSAAYSEPGPQATFCFSFTNTFPFVFTYG